MLLRMIRKIWNGSQETLGSALASRPSGVSRRDFLRAAGVTTTTVALGGMGGSLWLPQKQAIAGAVGMMGVSGAVGSAGAVPAYGQAAWPTPPEGLPEFVGWVSEMGPIPRMPRSQMLDPVQDALFKVLRDVMRYNARAAELERLILGTDGTLKLMHPVGQGTPSGFVTIGHLPGHEGPVVERIGDPLQQVRGEPVIG